MHFSDHEWCTNEKLTDTDEQTVQYANDDNVAGTGGGQHEEDQDVTAENTNKGRI